MRSLSAAGASRRIARNMGKKASESIFWGPFLRARRAQIVQGARPLRGMDETSETVLALQLAAAAQCDPRTAARALRGGTGLIRTRLIRERLERAMREIGVVPHPTRATG